MHRSKYPTLPEILAEWEQHNVTEEDIFRVCREITDTLAQLHEESLRRAAEEATAVRVKTVAADGLTKQWKAERCASQMLELMVVVTSRAADAKPLIVSAGYFFTSGWTCSSSEGGVRLYRLLWSAVDLLRARGISVTGVSYDGGVGNRQMVNLHRSAARSSTTPDDRGMSALRRQHSPARNHPRALVVPARCCQAAHSVIFFGHVGLVLLLLLLLLFVFFLCVDALEFASCEFSDDGLRFPQCWLLATRSLVT